MALSVGELQVVLTGDTRKLNRDLDQLDARAGKTEEAHTGAWKRIAVTAGAAIAAFGAVDFFRDSIKAASDAEQSIGGVQAVFKDYARTVLTASSEADRALGLSANSYRELATVIGSQLKNAGIPMDELSEKTGGLIAMGADLAAMFGGTTEEAVQALSSALKGEMDPIEKYGISLNDAALKAEAAAQGMEVMGGTLTNSQKAMAVMSLVTKQGADAVGAFGRESDTAAGRAQRASAQWENLKASVGDRLLPVWSTAMDFVGTTVIPVMGTVADIVGGAVSAFADLPGPVLAGVGVLTALMVINGPLAGAIGRSTLALASWYGQAVAASGATGILGAAMVGARGAATGLMGLMGGPLGLAITGVTVGLGFLVQALSGSSDASKDAADYQRDLADALRESKGAINDDVRALAAHRAEETKVGGKSLLKWANDLGVALPRVTDALLGNGAAMSEIRSKIQAQIAVLDEQASHLTQGSGQQAAAISAQREQLRSLLGAFGGLNGSMRGATEENKRLAAASAATGTAVQGAADATGAAAEQTVEDAKAAEDALQKWIDKLGGIADAFVDPLGTYKTMLQESAQATADSTKNQKDSWQDYVDSAKVNLDDYAKKLEEQITAQQNWQKNLGIIAQRAGLDVAQQLSQMGTDGVQLVAQMANGSDVEMQRMADLLRKDAQLAGSGAGTELDKQMKVMAAIGAAGASATAQGIATQLGIGVSDVVAIAKQYGDSLAGGINPILASLGKPLVMLGTGGGRAIGQAVYNADGGLYENHQAQIAPGGALRIWAEPETEGEAYIPLAPSKRDRSVGIWRETGKRLGVTFEEFGAGGFSGVNDVPRPRSTAPYQLPISTAGDATMRKGYDEVTAWLAANAESVMGGTPGSGTLGGTWVAIWNAVKAAIPQARINSTYRPGDPGYHGRNKAIDFGFGSGPGGAGSAGLASINRLLHDNYGRNLAELIYDGIGDDRPDLKNGRPLTYNAATRAQHHNHVHAAVYDTGGKVPPGISLLGNFTGGNEHMAVFTDRQWDTLRGMEAVARQAGAALVPGAGSARGGAAGRGSASSVQQQPVVQHVTNRNYNMKARVEHNITLREFIKQQREVDALYG